MLVRNAADELGQFGVRVNAIRPGLVPTDASSVLDGDEATRQDYLDQMPLGHTGETSDIGAAVRYLWATTLAGSPARSSASTVVTPCDVARICTRSSAST